MCPAGLEPAKEAWDLRLSAQVHEARGGVEDPSSLEHMVCHLAIQHLTCTAATWLCITEKTLSPTTISAW